MDCDRWILLRGLTDVMQDVPGQLGWPSCLADSVEVAVTGKTCFHPVVDCRGTECQTSVDTAQLSQDVAVTHPLSCQESDLHTLGFFGMVHHFVGRQKTW